MVLKFARTALRDEVFDRAICTDEGEEYYRRQSWQERMFTEVTLGLFVQYARRGWLNQT